MIKHGNAIINYLRWLLIRSMVTVSVIFIALTILFIVTRTSPKDPAAEVVSRIVIYGAGISGRELEMLRRQVYEMFGLDRPLIVQYVSFLTGILSGNIGPSFAFFPAQVADIIARSMPWTIILLLTSALISWTIGLVLGVFASIFEEKRFSKALIYYAMGLNPIPYAIFALAMFILFSILIPAYRGAGGFILRLDLDTLINLMSRIWLPALTIVLLWSTTWFLSTYMLSSNLKYEDFVEYAFLRGVPRRTLAIKYVLRSAAPPQVTALALNLGNIFSGALLTEYIFAYPGLGHTMMQGLLRADFNLILGIASYSVIGVALAALMLDIIYPFIDPRIRYGR